ncbi:MAG: hypothetical protein OER88_02745, partial [Planctomycetota bacterium]|nr:hypothetical protein [Planctomycetota bacterium]
RGFYRLPAAPDGADELRAFLGDVELPAWRETVAGEERLFVGGFAETTAALWIDMSGFAPVTVQGLREGFCGTLPLRRGTTLRFRLATRASELIPELRILARSLGDRSYHRTVLTDGSTTVALPGLGSGRFRVTAWNRYTGTPVWSDTIEVDGTNDHRIEIDLR